MENLKKKGDHWLGRGWGGVSVGGAMSQWPTLTGLAHCSPNPIPPMSLPLSHIVPLLPQFPVPTSKVSPLVENPKPTQPITTRNPSLLTATTTQVRRQLERLHQMEGSWLGHISHWMLRSCTLWWLQFSSISSTEPQPGQGAIALEDLRLLNWWPPIERPSTLMWGRCWRG